MRYVSGNSKYHATKVTVDGITFDSKREAKRYSELKLLERAGKIQNLKLQVKYDLVPSQKVGKRTWRGVSYIADFVYDLDGKTIVEDVKGVRTEVYKIKKKLMMFVHGIEIQEI